MTDNRTTEDIAKDLLRSYFNDVNWKTDALTRDEKRIVRNQENFNRLRDWARS